MPLSVRQIETLKSQDKPYKLADGGGLFLHVTPKGNKSWRLKYRFGGKEKLMTFGLFPSITLAEARQHRDKARAMLAAGMDPSEEKKSRRAESLISAGNTFQAIAQEWYDSKRRTWSENYAEQILSMLKKE
ncbi:tyrosine-type recombinase/integrase [Acerihabitans arboris]|uniref:Integrase arm-type DNA-binding domain-containing protein n=1 Tax=Acerihabitans arboris TaxID=2691583 RepID=A0A845SRS7_9GAMM|nr:Arm DNA-binding domain-containing protein [Acerihabitans arboris]NDL65348.1 integrase arm-type DNA-binding domain-containing protein [Acerihabitans arboris]